MLGLVAIGLLDDLQQNLVAPLLRDETLGLVDNGYTKNRKS